MKNDGIEVSLDEGVKTALTDQAVYFELTSTLDLLGTYFLSINKRGYLKHVIPLNNRMAAIVNLGTKENPIELWAGDVPIEGVSDNAINIRDIMTVAACFNSIKGKAEYNDIYDFNMDGVINISDIMITAMHFNKNSLIIRLLFGIDSHFPEQRNYCKIRVLDTNT